MANKAKGGLYGCGCGCITSTLISAIFIWLALRILTPTCTIEQFKHNSDNHTVHYDIKLKNRNFNKGIYYDALNITFSYKSTRSDIPIGNDTIPPFYQGYWKSAHRAGDVAVKGNVKGGDVFRMELRTDVRYKSPLWKFKRRSLVLGADLRVDGEGRLVKSKGEDGIVLVSSGVGRSLGCYSWLIGLLILVLKSLLV